MANTLVSSLLEKLRDIGNVRAVQILKKILPSLDDLITGLLVSSILA